MIARKIIRSSGTVYVTYFQGFLWSDIHQGSRQLFLHWLNTQEYIAAKTSNIIIYNNPNFNVGSIVQDNSFNIHNTYSQVYSWKTYENIFRIYIYIYSIIFIICCLSLDL